MHIGTIIILFLLGMLAGMAVALPYGPVGFVIIRRFYLFGMKSGMYSALGMALSDGFYAIVVGFGLQVISKFLLSIAPYAGMAAGLMLLYIGIHSIKQKLELQIDEEQKHPGRDIISTFIINSLNPTLIFWFALAFTIAGSKILHQPFSKTGTGVFIVGVVFGACALWYGIGRGIQYLRKNNRDALVHKMNYITGGILALLGVIVIIISIVHYF